MTLGAKPRSTMYSRALVFLIGAVHVYYQVLAAVGDDVYFGELMVQSNITLDTNTILSIFNTTDLQVSDPSAVSYTVTLMDTRVASDCLLIGDETNCTCSPGYVWSNPVCYSFNCCRETTCLQNVSDIAPLCISKVDVVINGSIILNGVIWDATKAALLKTFFEELNGFQSLNVTGERQDDDAVDFLAAVSVLFETSKLQEIIDNLERSLAVLLQVNTEGMVSIEASGDPVCYLSVPVLTCRLEEATGSAGWNLSTENGRFDLEQGSVVKLDHNCTTEEYKSCTQVKLQNVTGIWSGLYECGFTSGSIRHTSRALLNVILLPDVITLKIAPLAVNCFDLSSTDVVRVTVTATILKTHETFQVWLNYLGKKVISNPSISKGDYQVYNFSINVACQKTAEPHRVVVTFKNKMAQIKSEQVDIPVIYGGEVFCEGEFDINGDLWPNTPTRDTVINITCAENMIGYKSRTCEGTTWQPVFYYCVNAQLHKVGVEADNFHKGLNATHEMAMTIFSGLRNSSTISSDPTEYMADFNASINILDVMASASQYVALKEDVLPDLISTASNMLNKSWVGVNKSIIHDMSANYLQSVESLVDNIQVNGSAKDILYNENMQLKYCSNPECSMSLFGIDLSLNLTTGIMKTIAVKNLMDKLRNNFRETVPNSLLLSATIQKNKNSSLQIFMKFPLEKLEFPKPYCVFWNPKTKDWSDEGCAVVTPSNGNQTLCECEHLTSFSVLMAKEDISNPVLDIITYVGLGVSICSLLIFLTVEFLVWSAVVKSNLSHFRHTAIVNIATFLLLADCCFLASPKGIGETLCLALTVCKHLFFLAMFSWMMCLSVMLVHQLIFVFSPLRKKVFMFLSSIVGYVCPILIVGSSYTYCKYTYKPYFNKDTCWLVFERLLEGSIHAFLLPIGTVILTNLFSLVVVIVTVVKSSAPEGSKADDKETAKGIIKLVVFLTPIFGLTWIIGFALLLLDKGNPMFTFANYSFTILNSFQGLFLLITGCFAEQKVREEMLKIIMAKTKGKSESMKNLTSTTNTKGK